MSTPQFTNRLVHEKSPYLQQHAHNPVDWYPWGQEAFDIAKQLDKPVFLSIGYATCHWCHVMEQESFENPEIAQVLNEAFVNIKVDREELPEVDSIYMEFAQALMASAGGWPLNLVLTPDLKPFFATTYLPPVNRRGLLGVRQFAEHVRELWHSEDRKQLIEQADKIVEIFEQVAKTTGDSLPTEKHLHTSIEMLYEAMDPVYGGLKGVPKFPLGYQALLFLDFARLKKDSRALFCVDQTLECMSHGGIYDHLGGGFSRYAVDERWIVPHFEKMLYDNAALARAYLETWKYTKKGSFFAVCEETLEYICREMQHAPGGFYSAEDADTDGREGVYYTWTPQEVREVLSPEDAEVFCKYYGVEEEGDLEGRSVLHNETPLEEFAEVLELSVEELKARLTKMKAELIKKRQQRTRPFKDDKVITSWNGLAIDALIKAALPLKKPHFQEAAINAATFIKSHLKKEAHLLRRWRDNEARFEGSLDDYAFLIRALISLFEEGCGSEWLKWALELTDVLQTEFKAENDAYYFSLKDPALLLRKREFYDGAEPSGNAVHCENLLRLFQMTGDEKYLSQAEDVLKAAQAYIETYPPGACYHLIALQRYLNVQAPTVVIALDEEGSLKNDIHRALSERFIPHLAIVWKEAKDPLLSTLIPSLVAKNPIDGQTAVYICKQNHCEPPLIEKEKILQAIEII